MARQAARPGGSAMESGARLACELGGVPSVWMRAESLRQRLALVDALRAAGEHRRADAWLRALANFPRRAPDGSDLLDYVPADATSSLVPSSRLA